VSQLVPDFAVLRQTAVDAFPGEAAQVIPPIPRKPLTTTRTTEGLEADRRDNEKDEPCRQHDRAQNLRIDAKQSSNLPHQIDKRRAEKDAHQRPFDSAVFLPAFGVRAHAIILKPSIVSIPLLCQVFCYPTLGLSLYHRLPFPYSNPDQLRLFFRGEDLA
jgi:hypothetical protein